MNRFTYNFFDAYKDLLSIQLAYIGKNSEFYQKKFSDHHVKMEVNSFADFPFTTKKELLQNQLEHPPYGNYLCAPPSSIRRIHRTSGTTNKPLLIAMTAKDIEVTTNVGAKGFRISGLKEHDTVVHCLNYSMWMGGYTDHQSLEKAPAAVIPFGTGNSENLIDIIQLIKPTAIHCTPSYLKKLELILLEKQVKPKDLGIKLGLFGAEAGLQNQKFRNQIEETWGLSAMNANYGLSEALSMVGSECHLKRGLHFLGTGVVHPELRSLETSSMVDLANGNTGELILTNLSREAQPLIRYRTGDIVRILSVEPCECGFEGFRFEIIGRTDDMLVIKGVNVFISAIENVLSQEIHSFSGLFEVHVNVSDPIDRIKVIYETQVGEAVNDSQEFNHSLVMKFKSKLNITPEIEMVEYGKLFRSESKSRKLNRTL